MKYVEKNAQETESAYPYKGRGGSCQATSNAGKVKVTSIVNVRGGASAPLKDAIANGPVSVTVEADRRAFQGYTGGVMNSDACGTQLDHAITAIGYGNENGQDYYLVRNSWGGSWGDHGCIKIAMMTSGKGYCGIQQTSVYPITS
jgi:C1A family cysteine protease